VLFCNPLFEERKPAQRVMVETARELCRRGFAVLRFDYAGCGDSEGEFEEFSVPDWLENIRSASLFLRATAPSDHSGVLGLRLGSSFAVKAVGQGFVDAGFLALWEPIANGRDYLVAELRKKLMKETVTFGRSRTTVDSLMDSLASGESIDFDGYPITPVLHRDLCSLDLSTVTASGPARCLLVGIGASAVTPSHLARLNGVMLAAGAASEVVTVKEQPFWNLVGLASCPELIRLTAEWMSSSLEGKGR
jgi:exosortase A-associated hydrolase 2